MTVQHGIMKQLADGLILQLEQKEDYEQIFMRMQAIKELYAG